MRLLVAIHFCLRVPFSTDRRDLYGTQQVKVPYRWLWRDPLLDFLAAPARITKLRSWSQICRLSLALSNRLVIRALLPVVAALWEKQRVASLAL